MDEIEQGATEISNLLDSESGAGAVADRLRSDYLNMSPDKFKKLVEEIDRLDKKGVGDDIELNDKDKDGMPEVKIKDNLNLPFLSIAYDSSSAVGTKTENSDTGTSIGRNLQRLLGADDPYKNRVPEQKRN